MDLFSVLHGIFIPNIQKVTFENSLVPRTRSLNGYERAGAILKTLFPAQTQLCMC